MRIAILDDYQNIALRMTDWSEITSRAAVTVFHDNLSDLNALAERLGTYDVLCVMRERTPLPRALLERLPRLRLIVSTGSRNHSIDTQAASELGIELRYTGYSAESAIEMTWALILAGARRLVDEANSLRAGGWQQHLGIGLHGKTLGVLGLGRIGSHIARIGRAFGMEVIAWSENLTAERAQNAGARLVTRETLFSEADILTIHLLLSARTFGMVDSHALATMKPQAMLINTARGEIVDEPALLTALSQNRLAFAALDVFSQEPLPPDHPFRSAPKLLATPHIGYVTRDLYQIFYHDTVEQLKYWLDAHD